MDNISSILIACDNRLQAYKDKRDSLPKDDYKEQQVLLYEYHKQEHGIWVDLNCAGDRMAIKAFLDKR